MMSNQVYSKFDIETLYSSNVAEISFPSTIKYAIVGKDVDDRCCVAHTFLSSKYEIYSIDYDAENFIVSFNERNIDADDFAILNIL